LREPQFILDVHLGKLARYLRLLGFDTIYDRDYADSNIINMAAKTNRIILTRDTGLLKNKNVTRGYWIRETDPNQQIQEVLHKFDLSTKIKSFTRCLECNGKLVKTDKEILSKKLLPKTKKFYHDFVICLHCEKIYWAGSHYQRMKKFIERLTGNLKEK